MADQLPAQDLTAIGAVAGMAEIGLIADIERAVLAAGTQVDPGGGHYAFHPAELKTVIDGWQNVIDTITSGRTTTVTRTPHSPAVMVPGNEQASNVASDAAHATNQAYQDYLTKALQYAQGVHDKLNTIYTNYLITEQSQADAARSLEA
jgi:hypothetical protein